MVGKPLIQNSKWSEANLSRKWAETIDFIQNEYVFTDLVEMGLVKGPLSSPMNSLIHRRHCDGAQIEQVLKRKKKKMMMKRKGRRR